MPKTKSSNAAPATDEELLAGWLCLDAAMEMSFAWFLWRRRFCPDEMDRAAKTMEGAAMLASMISLRAVNDFFLGEEKQRFGDLGANRWPRAPAVEPYLNEEERRELHRLAAHLTLDSVGALSQRFDLLPYAARALATVARFMEWLRDIHFVENMEFRAQIDQRLGNHREILAEWKALSASSPGG